MSPVNISVIVGSGDGLGSITAVAVGLATGTTSGVLVATAVGSTSVG
jgi:hypothetical protein